MEKYLGLINPYKLKREFIKNFLLALSPAENAYEKWLETQKSNYYVLKEEDTAKCLEISFTLYTLIEKVSHMLNKGGGLKDVLIMLNSFSRGTKRIKSNPHDRVTDDLYEWTEKNGNEKYSHKGNLPNAHFRWNFGERYTLTDEELNKIQGFINPFLKLLN